MTSASKKISYKSGSVSIRAQMNKYIPSTFVYMRFDTSERSLLYNLLQKYIHEKTIGTGINRINEISYAYATERGIVFNCTERKILINIANILAYVEKTKLKNKELDRMTVETAKYKKLHNDCKSFDVFVSGKCPHVIRSLTGSGDKKIEKLIDMLNKVEAKDIDDMSSKKHIDLESIAYSGNSREKLDLAVILENVPFMIEGDKVKFIDPHSACAIVERSEFDYLQTKLKMFLISCGSPGTPSANDKGGKAYKEKCDNIVACLNSIAFIIADSHGFKHEFGSAKDIQDGVRAESKTKITEFFKETKKLFM